MTQLIHALKLEKNRHVLRAGQRARQIAGLLGFDAREQSAISAAVFAIAYKAVADSKPAKLKFFLGDDRLMVQCHTSSDKKWDRRRQTRMSGPPITHHSPLTTHHSPVHWWSALFGDLALEPGLSTLSFPLPGVSPRLDSADLPWVIREMSRITPLDPIEEFFHLNRELLRLLRLTEAARTSETAGGHAA